MNTLPAKSNTDLPTASLKQIMSEPPMDGASYARLQKQRTNARRRIEDLRERKLHEPELLCP